MCEQLKHCPCCGREAVIIAQPHPASGDKTYFAACSKCGLSTYYSESKSQVITYWNRREGEQNSERATEALAVLKKLNNELNDAIKQLETIDSKNYDEKCVACPKCGNSNCSVALHSFYDGDVWLVSCPDCGFQSERGSLFRQEAIDIWNKRYAEVKK